DNANDASGGGVSVGGGQVYVTTGFGEITAMDAATGDVRWVQDLGNLKLSAEVLATAGGSGVGAGFDQSDPGAGDPLVTRLRFGAGQSLYVGTDETWRWRYARGEVYFEQFWVQLVRLLGRSAATRSDDAVRMNVSARQTPRGGTVVVDVDIDDAALLARNLPSLRVAVRGADGDHTATLAEFELRPAANDETHSGGGGRYSSPWLAGVSGELELVVTEPALAGFDLRVPLDVVAPDDERRRAEADVPRLIKLARDTGGRVVPLDDLAQLTRPGVVRNLARKTANDVAEPIWNSALALALVVGLITLEWVGRKLVRLV
ncbi:MAG: PQQ-binding-like beta-propeller repeat protein, partial [Planctomycetota bacterium]